MNHNDIAGATGVPPVERAFKVIRSARFAEPNA
jgi:hypothetical protein